MDFDFNDEQRMLKDSVNQLIADRYTFEQRKSYMKDASGFSRDVWNQFAEMGLLGLPFDEKFGGVGYTDGGAVETMIVMEAFGRGLTLEPYLATVVLGGGLIHRGGNDAQREALLPKIADGSLMLAFAHEEAQSRYNLADVATTAKRDADGWLLTGEKNFVVHGNCADKIIVSARIAGDRASRDGIGLFLVDAKAPGVARKSYETQDGQRAAQIRLSGVKVSSNDAIGDPDKALPLIEKVTDTALAAVAAEAVGAMSAAHEVTLDYLRTRKQFGVAIGSFQVLQHRAVDVLVSLEQARSMAYYATMMANDPDPAERSKAISAATVQIRRSGKFVGQQVVQLHGGIGMTLEYKIGHYFKRLTAMELLLGDTDYHLAALARAGGLIEASA